MSFYFLLGLFPLLASIISFYGFFADPDTVKDQIEKLQGLLPEQTIQFIASELDAIVQSGRVAGFTALLAFLISLFAGSKVMSAMIVGVNTAFSREPKRSYLKRKAMSLLLSLGAVLLFTFLTAVLAAIPVLLNASGIFGFSAFLRWPITILGTALLIATLYRIAYSVNELSWRWILPGTIAATTIWLLGSVLLSIYLTRSSGLSLTYGRLGDMMGLMFWLFIAAYSIILGAELNAALKERHGRE